MWSKILKSHGLTKDQEQIISAYEQDTQGKAFLKMAQLLVKFGYQDHSIEILMAGVALYPEYTIARVTLVSALWNKGLFFVAWEMIDHQDSSKYEGNLLAWGLILKLSLVLEFEDHARVAVANLQSELDLDLELQNLIKIYTFSGYKAAKHQLLENFSPQVIKDLEYTIKQNKIQISEENPCQQSLTDNSDDQADKIADTCENDSSFLNNHEKFYAVSLNQIFSSCSDEADKNTKIGLELDSLTLAEIFERQQCIKPALDIYKRLFNQSPTNDLLKNKIIDLEKKIELSKSLNLDHTNEIIDRLDHKKIIDQKRFFYQHLLENIERKKRKINSHQKPNDRYTDRLSSLSK